MKKFALAILILINLSVFAQSTEQPKYGQLVVKNGHTVSGTGFSGIFLRKIGTSDWGRNYAINRDTPGTITLEEGLYEIKIIFFHNNSTRESILTNENIFIRADCLTEITVTWIKMDVAPIKKIDGL